MALASSRRTTSARRANGKAAATSSRRMIFSSAARPGTSVAVLPQSKDAPEWRGSSMPRTWMSTALPNLRSTAAGKSGVRRSAMVGTPNQATRSRDAVAPILQALAALQCAGAVNQGSARVDFGGKGLIGNFQPFQNRTVKASKAQKAIRRRQFLQFVIGPFVERVAVMAGDLKAGRLENDEHVMPSAGNAVEINAGTGCHGNVHQYPPTLSASARPSPIAELGRPVAFTLSSPERPDNCS